MKLILCVLMCLMGSTHSLDIDRPVECDDEWLDLHFSATRVIFKTHSRQDHPDHRLAWKQPAGSPSVLEFFNAFIGLTDLLLLCSQRIVSASSQIWFC